MTRYLVIRCPTSGPPALIAPPNDFGSEAEARARIGEIEAAHRMAHHTHLEVMAYDGDRLAALDATGILY
jgi:hypothetical protein